MSTSVLQTPGGESRTTPDARLRHSYWMAGAYLACMAMQAIGYIALGTGRAGMSVSELLIIAQHFLAIGCAIVALRRARGTSTIFWVLFIVTVTVLLIPNALQTWGTLTATNLVSDRTWRALYTLYGAPVLMMLVLPDSERNNSARSETFLDLFQVALVVGLLFATFFYLPIHEMLPADAFQHSLTVSNLVSLFLMIAVLVRLQFARALGAHSRLLRLGLFLLSCAVITFIGNWIDESHYVTAAAWWDLGWDIPILVAGMVAISWRPAQGPETIAFRFSFSAIVVRNLSLVAVLVFLDVLMDLRRNADASLIADVAVAMSLLSLTIRYALTQHHQQQEIVQRQAAQHQLTVANQKIGALLDESRRRTAEITQINELGSLLQACSSPPEAYKLIAERLQQLFPGGSGSLALLNASSNRVESVAEWGISPPRDQVYAPNECWALRRGCIHALASGASVLRCSHLQNEESSVCIPLVGNGATLGTLAIQGGVRPFGSESLPRESDAFSHHLDLVTAVGEHIALALADLALREALRVQAVRDPLTGLYNRRYMHEFLDREGRRAHRKNRPLAILALDLDHFKVFNDTYGHAAGDHALSTVGDVLLHCVRADDVACRYGGEEFILILPECNLKQAIIRAEQIRMRLRQRPIEYLGVVQKPLTVSIGVATYDETTDRIELLLGCADEALYQAKREGRDRVVSASPVAIEEKTMPDSASAASM